MEIALETAAEADFRSSPGGRRGRPRRMAYILLYHPYFHVPHCGISFLISFYQPSTSSPYRTEFVQFNHCIASYLVRYEENLYPFSQGIAISMLLPFSYRAGEGTDADTEIYRLLQKQPGFF